MIRNLIAEFITFLTLKNDNRYMELEERIRQLEAELRKPVRVYNRDLPTVSPSVEIGRLEKRLQIVEKKVNIEQYLR